jgi:N-acetyl-anhydromuramyl-L-alanine amidase AmpD
MGSRRGQVGALGAVVLSAAVGASASSGASLRVLMSHTPNKTSTNRTADSINGIVIHDTEGRFIGSIRALQNPRVDGSAHFVVSRSGQIVQLVSVTDVAWHAGNTWWNRHSIGIEHEGWVTRPYTEKEYRASAKLTAYLAHRWTIPIDREHIIGHAEVPDPYHKGRFGGFAHHTDPGRHWRWAHYMKLVRYYARHPVLPAFVKHLTLHDSPPFRTRTVVVHATPVRVTPLRSVVDRHATVRGKALWWSGVDATTRWRRHIYKVDFLVDGKLAYTDNTWPYSFHRTVGWDSRSVANGSHMLTVLSYGTRHYRVRKRVPVRVDNAPITLAVSGAADGGAVHGTVDLAVRPSEPVERVALYVNGAPVSRDSTAPYRLAWDTTSQPEGVQTITLVGHAKSGRRATLQLPVIVANNPAFPPALASTWQPPLDGATTSLGRVTPDS